MKIFSAAILILVIAISLTACNGYTDSLIESSSVETEDNPDNSAIISASQSSDEDTESSAIASSSDRSTISSSAVEIQEPPFAVTTERPLYIDDRINFEDGFWFPAEFTEEDLVLQEFLKETSENAYFLEGMFHNCKVEGIISSDDAPTFVFTQSKKPVNEQSGQSYYPASSKYPQTRD